VEEDGVVWIQRLDDPSAFGVVVTDEEGNIREFVEKPKDFISDQAIVGIYYFRDGEKLRDTLRYLIKENIREKNEFQITTALQILKDQGARIKTSPVDEWLDCGNKENILHTNARMMELHSSEELVSASARLENAVIIPPCFIGENAFVKNSVLGPYVSVGANSTVEDAVIVNSIIQNGASIKNAVLENSMVGNSSRYAGARYELDLGDFSNFSKH
jgi:glucose-1-phosphate thymidylyltransferase